MMNTEACMKAIDPKVRQQQLDAARDAEIARIRQLSPAELEKHRQQMQQLMGAASRRRNKS
jgi:hypothetical protein